MPTLGYAKVMPSLSARRQPSTHVPLREGCGQGWGRGHAEPVPEALLDFIGELMEAPLLSSLPQRAHCACVCVCGVRGVNSKSTKVLTQSFGV